MGARAARVAGRKGRERGKGRGRAESRADSLVESRAESWDEREERAMDLSGLLEIEAKLTGPGGPFEMVEEEVLGQKTKVIKGRHPSLRAIVEQSVAHGDKEYIVCEGRRISFAIRYTMM